MKTKANRIMMRCLFSAGLLAAAATLASAQTSPAPAMAAAPTTTTSSPAKKALVAKVVALQQPAIDGLASSLAQQPLARLMLMANQALRARVPADKRQAVIKDIDAEARRYLDEVTPLLRQHAEQLAPSVLGPILEERFNEDELRQIAAWLESPVNKKYQEVAPEIQKALAQRLVADTRGSVEPKIEALEKRVSALLGLPAGTASRAPASAASTAPAASGAAVKSKP